MPDIHPLVAQLITIVFALLVAGLSAWATFRAYERFSTQASKLILHLALAWLVPILGAIIVLLLGKNKSTGSQNN